MMNFRKGDTTHALRDGGLVCIDDSGNIVPVKNDSTDRVIGVCRLNVALTDTSSWTGAPIVPVQVPVENAVEWEMDLDSDVGALDSDVGRYCAVDTTGGNSVLTGDSAGMRIDISDTAIRQILTTKIISGSKIIGVIVRNAFDGRFSDTA